VSRLYLLYQCAPSTEIKGYRANYDGGCLRWGIRTRAATNPVTDVNQVQARCTACQRRPRLSPKNISVFYDKLSAEAERDKRNYEGGLL
jgi:hypothetical protein